VNNSEYKFMKVKVWVDNVKCTTFASCTIATDPVFILNDDGKAIIDVEKVKSNPAIKSIVEEVGEQNYPQWIIETDDAKWIEENLTDGAMRCPVFAIFVTDLDNNKVLFPV